MQGWTAKWLLEQLGAELGGREGVDLEFSLRLTQGRVDAEGRFGCWLAGGDSSAFAPMARVLERLAAPEAVRAAQRDAVLPVRQGLAVGFIDGVPELRLYLHGRAPATLADDYRAWRWLAGGEARRSRYFFHYLPETPSGLRPSTRVPSTLRPAFEQLLRDERLQQSSGFWLREGSDGQVEQVDLAFPWCPIAGTLEGVRELATVLGVREDSRWRELPIRHVAVRVGEGAPQVTLYASASLRGAWPVSEAELQQRVREEALSFQREVEESVFRRLPSMPRIIGPEPAGLDAFYGGDVKTWQTVLGQELHYHAGLFDASELDASDEAMEAALRRAVTTLYPFIPEGSRVYDVGCGWGGPLAMWIRDLRCRSLGVTISRGQFQYIAGLGLPVRWGDAEQTLPPGHFDCAVLLESLSHIRDKGRLLRVLRVFSDRLVMRVNCQDASPASSAFGGTMHMVSSARLRELVESAGWRIRHWRDCRREAVPSVAVWHRRLQAVPVGEDRHLETLRAWCERVMTAPEAWAANNPLIEVVAD
ncbi:class I SAM-dependent methyltransferase [Pyxidicoccus parkwayensis]|uniref:Class I SAM-dependent methyltransferase n=1 Tax=Pyxidicoccus parkwayensis TaxID=2813578 RepID=A0ABX7P7E3_9BACT|nr:class I SAM-dependent methyltransferase [Pyxidicoccus parkwaysis]QSQ26372.1 class I SAM-dependent methyltransferase [Pyxidicoccus parkwaysis]